MAFLTKEAFEALQDLSIIKATYKYNEKMEDSKFFALQDGVWLEMFAHCVDCMNECTMKGIPEGERTYLTGEARLPAWDYFHTIELISVPYSTEEFRLKKVEALVVGEAPAFKTIKEIE